MNKNAPIINKESIDNWRDKKFGMFVHWGLYSKGDIGEWSMYLGPIDVDEYAERANEFNPDKFDATKWAKLAKSAGMNYVVLTAKHHDGFSLWDSKACLNDHTSVNSPAKRDFIKEYVEAVRNEGLMVGLYYSPLDWRFPGFFLPQMYKKSAEALVKQAHDQIRELMTGYGKIDLLWFDGAEDFWVAHGFHLHKFARPQDFKNNPQVKNFWRAGELDKMIREKQPGIICNDRIGDKSYGDYFAPEKKIGEYNTVDPWETCDTMTNTWSYRPDAQIRSLRNCIQLLAKVVCNGGNLLLNVAPKFDGSFEEAEIKRLSEIGEWLSKYGESIYGTRGGPIKVDDWGGTANKDNKLYFHVLDWVNDEIFVPNVYGAKVKCLTGAPISVREEKGMLAISVPFEYRQEMDTVIEVTYDKKVTDFIADATDYNDLCKKAVYENVAVIVADV